MLQIKRKDFDVPVGCYNSTEVCKIVVSHILNLLHKIFNKDLVDLYKDNGFVISEFLSSLKIECGLLYIEFILQNKFIQISDISSSEIVFS